MRSGGPSGHAHEAYRASHSDARAGTHAGCEVAHVAVSAHHAVPVPDVDHVAVAALSAGEDHDAVPNRANRSSLSGRVIRSGVIAPFAEDRMLAGAEHTADATECEGSTEKRGAQRQPAGIVELSDARAWRVEVNR